MLIIGQRVHKTLARALFVAAMALSLAPAASATTFYTSSGYPNIYVIDSVSNAVIASIPTTGPTTYLAVASDGSRAVALEPSSSVLHVITTATNSDNPLHLAVGVLTSLALSADGKTAYIGYVQDAGGYRLIIFDIDNAVVVKDIVLTAPARKMALTVDGKKLLVYLGETVDIYDVATLSVSASIAVSPHTQSLAISPTLPRAYLLSEDGTMSVIDTQANTLLSTIPTNGNYSYFIAVSPDGKRIYIVQSSEVLVLDSQTNAPLADISILSTSNAHAIALTPDGKYAYLSESVAGDVTVIDTTSYTIVASIPVPGAFLIATNGIPVTPPPPPASTPFAKFTPELLVAPKLSAYSVAASFTLARTATGFSPTTQDLTLTVGTYSVKVPAGSIKRPNPKFDLYTYRGSINGAGFGLVLTGKETGPWGIVAVGSHAFGTLPGTVPVTLTVGPNSGSTSVKPVTASRVQSLD